MYRSLVFVPWSRRIRSRVRSSNVLALLGNDGTLRFNKLAEKLPGISAKTLTEVLKDLQRTGLVKRQAFAEIPPRVEYHLTKEGNELTMLVAPLMVWADNRTGLVKLES